ncbi:hypothetical protein G3I18_23135 [Actinospica acidiphila]|uniref:Uncharacterized protein n=1 Tax=Actinospica acidiphila TaxID=304899 RepID=A0A9X5CMW5_9ACTN|nr:hypothetical protein [Actinospica acidiphila]NEC51429.1 hypothetical protein [Actinospica acidiphila]
MSEPPTDPRLRALIDTLRPGSCAGVRRRGHPSEAVEAGRRITAEVVVADTRSGRVTLSLKGAGTARC